MLFSVIYAVRQPEFSVELYLQSIKRINVETIGIKIYVFYPHFQTLKTRSEGPFFWEKCYQDPYRSTIIKVIYMSISNNTWFYYQNLLGYKTLTSIAQFEISFRTSALCLVLHLFTYLFHGRTLKQIDIRWDLKACYRSSYER